MVYTKQQLLTVNRTLPLIVKNAEKSQCYQIIQTWLTCVTFYADASFTNNNFACLGGPKQAFGNFTMWI